MQRLTCVRVALRGSPSLSLRPMVHQQSLRAFTLGKASPANAQRELMANARRNMCIAAKAPGAKDRLHDMFEADASMYLTDEVSKLIFFVRHAEGTHNAAARDKNEEFRKNLFNSPTLWDAPLTPTGLEQCARLKSEIDSVGADVDLIVVSPLTRTLQTASLSFGTSQPLTPMLACETCRERIAVYTSEGRAQLSELKPKWPLVDFSQILSEEDKMFSQKEDDKVVAERALVFMNWLMQRPERRIAVVSHSVFLQNMYKNYSETLPASFFNERQEFAGMKTVAVVKRQ